MVVGLSVSATTVCKRLRISKLLHDSWPLGGGNNQTDTALGTSRLCVARSRTTSTFGEIAKMSGAATEGRKSPVFVANSSFAPNRYRFG
jgi:hypothetical protein